MNEFNWRDAFMALVDRTQSKRLTITSEALQKAKKTNNGMIIEDGKYTIIAGEFGVTESINADMQNGYDEISGNMEGAE